MNLPKTTHTSDCSWRDNIKKLKDCYEKEGYVIVDDFLPQEVAEEINTLYKSETSWEQIDQVRETHYQHVFKTDCPFLPSEDESYMARFDRSPNLEKSEKVNSLYNEHFKPALSDVSGISLTEFDIRCYQLQSGDFYRTHIDDYAASVGLVYYINKSWIWDWGGILHIAKSDEAISILPKFNRAMILNHEKFRFPHFISAVTDYAKNPRYTIVSFNK